MEEKQAKCITQNILITFKKILWWFGGNHSLYYSEMLIFFVMVFKSSHGVLSLWSTVFSSWCLEKCTNDTKSFLRHGQCLSTHILRKSNCSYLSSLCGNGTHLSERLCPAAGTDSKACTIAWKSPEKAICLLPLSYWCNRPIAFYLHSVHHHATASLLHHILLYGLTV